MNFDINKFRNIQQEADRYKKQLSRLKREGKETTFIEKVVKEAKENLNKRIDSFIIYGDPQSGKTEMMIVLTAKLLDEGHKIIIVLLNDHVGLLEQNLNRFSNSGIDPDPKNYKEIMDEVYKIKDYEWIIFCKKNQYDLKKLIQKIKGFPKRVIIDDEADYASPNGKISRDEKTKINQLVGELLGDKGIYIGVTATPARLDLNNTFENANNNWIYFQPHKFYKGQEEFFPTDLKNAKLNYQLEFLPEQYDSPKYLREALFRFFVNVAYINLYKNNNDPDKHYSMLIHTSGRTNDHLKDHKDIVAVIDFLKDRENFDKNVETIHEIATDKYGNDRADNITKYILQNKNKNTVLIINSKNDRENLFKVTDTKALFTIAIGGNIISRGVTFDNLLSMYFTRTVKTKMQQDTYIQRARMFGSRGDYLKFFELTIPKQLYVDWHRCFVLHKLALDSAKRGNPPVWLEDKKTRPVATGSIDKTNVQSYSGEMSYEIFDYTENINDLITRDIISIQKLKKLREKLDDSKLPSHLIEFIESFSLDGPDSLAIHSSTSIKGYKDAEQENVSRLKGFIGKGDLEERKFPHAIHHIKIFYNENKKARVFYRFIGVDGIKFLKNFKQP